jgi:hypothetical protein
LPIGRGLPANQSEIIDCLKGNAGSDLASRGVEPPDRADALIGAIMLGIGSDPYALNPGARQAMHENGSDNPSNGTQTVYRLPWST